jgi:hypothetical protein
MDPLLLIITVISLGVAVVTSASAWRASQQEKRRADARVAALAAAAGVQTTAGNEGIRARTAPESPVGTVSAPWRRPVGLDPSGWDGEGAATDLQANQSRAASEAPGPDPVSIRTGFLGAESPAREGNTHQRWLAAAAAVVAVLLGGFVTVRMSTQAPSAQAAPNETAPLELLSLRHEREGPNLSVAGLVRNPPAGSVVERLTAVVFLFDQQGQFVTSAKAPIDFLKLTAGDESPFVVKVAAPQTVARYRVSFRTDDGTRPHVDRRGDPPVAAPVALTTK